MPRTASTSPLAWRTTSTSLLERTLREAAPFADRSRSLAMPSRSVKMVGATRHRPNCGPLPPSRASPGNQRTASRPQRGTPRSRSPLSRDTGRARAAAASPRIGDRSAVLPLARRSAECRSSTGRRWRQRRAARGGQGLQPSTWGAARTEELSTRSTTAGRIMARIVDWSSPQPLPPIRADSAPVPCEIAPRLWSLRCWWLSFFGHSRTRHSSTIGSTAGRCSICSTPTSFSFRSWWATPSLPRCFGEHCSACHSDSRLAALRVSTWVLGVLALCALYLLVRECGGTRRSALMAAAVLGFYPVFFILSPTFMTDVPFLAAMLWSALLFVRALHRRRVALVWLAAAVCAASVGSRVIGVGVAGAMIATLLFHTGRWGRRIHVLLAPALIGPFAVWLFVWTRARVFTSADITWLPNGPQQRLANLRYAFGADILPSMLVETLLFALVLVGIALLPIAVGLVRRAIVRRTAYVFVVVCGRLDHRQARRPCRMGPVRARRHLGLTRDRRRGVVRAGMAAPTRFRGGWPRPP